MPEEISFRRHLLVPWGLAVASGLMVIPSIFLAAALAPGLLAQNYVVETPASELRGTISVVLIVMFAVLVVYGLVWVRSEREKMWHPLVVVAASPLSCWAFDFLWRLLSGSIPLAEVVSMVLGGLFVFPLPLVAASFLRLRSAKTSARGVTVLIAGVVLVAAVVFVGPKKLDYPHDAFHTERDAWAREHVGEPYLVARRELAPIAERVGPDAKISPVKRGSLKVRETEDSTITHMTISFDIHGANESWRCKVDGAYDRSEPEDSFFGGGPFPFVCRDGEGEKRTFGLGGDELFIVDD